MRDWDPIGVAAIPEASDEYDQYVGRAYVMLMDERATVADIASYLLEGATERMGLPETQDLTERSDRAARTLVALRPEFETH